MKRWYTYTIILEPAAEGGYVVSVPALPGCLTHGKTYEEALANAKEAIQGFIEFLQKLGRAVPVEPEHSQELRSQIKIPTMA